MKYTDGLVADLDPGVNAISGISDTANLVVSDVDYPDKAVASTTSTSTSTTSTSTTSSSSTTTAGAGPGRRKRAISADSMLQYKGSYVFGYDSSQEKIVVMTNKQSSGPHLCFIPKISGISQKGLILEKAKVTKALKIVRNEFVKFKAAFEEYASDCGAHTSTEIPSLPRWSPKLTLILSELMSLSNTATDLAKLRRILERTRKLPSMLARSRTLLGHGLLDLGAGTCQLGSGSMGKCFVRDGEVAWNKLALPRSEKQISEIEYPAGQPEKCLQTGLAYDNILDSECCKSIQDEKGSVKCPLDQNVISPITRDRFGVLQVPAGAEIQAHCSGSEKKVKSASGLLSSCSLTISLGGRTYKIAGNGGSLVRLGEQQMEKEESAEFWYKTTFVVMAVMITGLTLLVLLLLALKCKCCWVINCCFRRGRRDPEARPRNGQLIRLNDGAQRQNGNEEEIVRLYSNGLSWNVHCPATL